MATHMQHQREGGSQPLWAFILIGVGAIWLLAQADVLTSANLVVLFRMWPLVLIAVGLELLIGRRSRSLSLLIGAGTVVILLVLMVVGPSLGLAGNSEIQTLQYTEPLDDATSAQLDLGLSVGNVTVQALNDSNDLIDADLHYIGDVNFDTSTANNQKFVTLTAENDSANFSDFLGFSLANFRDDEALRWNIGLTPLIPLDLRFNGGVGETTVDLSGVQLSSLNYQGGVGRTTISLPDGSSYSFDLDGGVGETIINFAEGAAVDATITGGVGGIILDIPEGLPVRLENEAGLGGITLPDGFERISGENSDNDGVWETETFRSANDDARVIIEVEGGVGGLTVR